MTFQERLKCIRQKRNISIRRLCRDLKLQKSTYENWEIDVYPSRPEAYKRLAEYLDVPLEYLMFGERKNTEWEEAIIHLRKFVEELIEAKVKMVLNEMRSKRAGMSGQKRGVLSQ
ncbi:helix-turn-helix transcriptional regulator [Thermodesulfobacteriota bacterium]